MIFNKFYTKNSSKIYRKYIPHQKLELSLGLYDDNVIHLGKIL